MTNEDDMLGIAPGKYPAKKKKKNVRRESSMGGLYDLLKRGLPDYVDDGKLLVKPLAERLGISYQAMYKWFERNTISPARIDDVVSLSNESAEKMYSEFVPLCRDDFWPFMGR